MGGRRPKNLGRSQKGRNPYGPCLDTHSGKFSVPVVKEKFLAHRNAYGQGTYDKGSDRRHLKRKEPRLRDWNCRLSVPSTYASPRSLEKKRTSITRLKLYRSLFYQMLTQALEKKRTSITRLKLSDVSFPVRELVHILEKKRTSITRLKLNKEQLMSKPKVLDLKRKEPRLRDWNSNFSRKA